MVNTWLFLVIGGLVFVLLLYISLEIHYFIRMGITVFLAKFIKKKIHVMDTTKITGLCMTTDVDALLFHMNNARYLRELDFARVDFYQRSGLLTAITVKGGSVYQGASTIRYRRFIRPFTIYHITSKLIYWDETCLYMEHRFITPKDNFVRAVALCKQRLVGVSAEDIIKELGAGGKPGSPVVLEGGGPLEKPPIPLELAKWNESNQISSENLRNGC